MSLTASARAVPGTLRQEVLIDGHHRLATDEPERLGGEGRAPAPHELLPAALAACISTTLVMYARTKEWDLGDVTVDVIYEHKASPRRFGISITLSGDLRPEQLERLEKVAAACPLRQALETGFEFDERFERRVWPHENAGIAGAKVGTFVSPAVEEQHGDARAVAADEDVGLEPGAPRRARPRSGDSLSPMRKSRNVLSGHADARGAAPGEGRDN